MDEKDMKVYSYSGPVVVNGSVTDWKWKTTTWASSKRKAISNLKHRYRDICKLSPYSKVKLEGSIVCKEEENVL